MSSLLVSTVLSTSSFFLCSVQDTFNMQRQICISKASVLFMSLFCNVHTTLYSTQMLWLCFFSWRLRDPHMRSFFWLKASFFNPHKFDWWQRLLTKSWRICYYYYYYYCFCCCCCCCCCCYVNKPTLFYEHDLFHQLQFKPSVALISTGRYSTRLWCYSVVACYSDVVIDTECWIGLYKSEPERSASSTYWLDGNPSTYRNWHRSEPNQVEPCVYIRSDKFYDGPCTRTFRYICKGISVKKSFFVNFYRAMLAHSMIACRLSVCLSVCNV